MASQGAVGVSGVDAVTDDGGVEGPGTGPAVRVLLVEDDEPMSELVRAYLRRAPDRFDVTRVATVAAARERYATAPFDVVLLDLGLPDAADPMQAVLEIVGWQPAPCVVVLTGLAGPSLGIEAMRHGATDFLRKDDVDADRLVTSVRHALARHRRLARQAARAAELARRLEDLDSYVTAISHDLRMPLGTAEAMLSVLTSRGGQLNREQSDELTTAAQRQVGKALSFVEELFADAVAGNERRAELDLHRIVRDAAVVAAVADGVLEVGELPTGLWGRAAALQQVLVNLIANAVAYADADEPRVRVSGARRDAVATLVVEDNGPGVPVELRQRVFDRDESHRPGGTGIGLDTVQRHVRTHGGRVWVEESATLGGASFVVELPIRVRDR